MGVRQQYRYSQEAIGECQIGIVKHIDDDGVTFFRSVLWVYPAITFSNSSMELPLNWNFLMNNVRVDP